MKNRKTAVLILVCLVIFGFGLGYMLGRMQKDNVPVSPSSSSRPEVSSPSSISKPAPSQQVREVYTMEDVYGLKDTENFSKNAIEHIFNGSVNSKGKASGYHYDMITDSDGKIIEDTRGPEDEFGVYTAYVTVNGKKKSHYSTFFPDSWTPQQVVDAINRAREDALENDRIVNSTWIGYYEGIEIDMYLDSSDRITTAYPVHASERTKIDG